MIDDDDSEEALAADNDDPEYPETGVGAEIAELYAEETEAEEDPQSDLRREVDFDGDVDDTPWPKVRGPALRHTRAETEDEANPDWYALPETGFSRERIDDDFTVHWYDLPDPDSPNPDAVAALGTRKTASGKLSPGISKPAKGIEWFYDDKSYYAYVLVSAAHSGVDAPKIDGIKRALSKHGVTALLDGRSLRPGSNGVQYQWYIRVQSVKGGKPSAADVRAALGAPVETPKGPSRRSIKPRARPTDDSANALATSRRRNAELEKRLDEVRKTLSESQNARRIAHERLETEREGFVARIQHLVKALSETKESAANEQRRIALLEEEKQRLHADHIAATELLEESAAQASSLESAAEKIVAEAEVKVREMENQLASACAERDDFQARLYDLSRITSPATSSSTSNSEDEIGGILSCTLPSISFLNGSLSVMLYELGDMGHVLDLLTQLDRSGHIQGQTPVQGAGSWKEARFSTGSARDGRLYFARAAKDDRWVVLVAKKATQKADIRYLKRK